MKTNYDTYYPDIDRQDDALQTYFNELLDSLKYESVEVVDRMAWRTLSKEAYEEWLLVLKDYLGQEEKCE